MSLHGKNAKPAIRTGVGAVVFRGEQVLLIKRGKEPFKGQWSIPGGGLEYGETLHAGIKREVAEETGVEIDIIALLEVYENLPERSGDHHNIMVDYIAAWKSGEPVAGDDAVAAQFFPYEEALSRVAWDLTRTAIRDAFKHLQKDGALG